MYTHSYHECISVLLQYVVIHGAVVDVDHVALTLGPS